MKRHAANGARVAGERVQELAAPRAPNAHRSICRPGNDARAVRREQ